MGSATMEMAWNIHGVKASGPVDVSTVDHVVTTTTFNYYLALPHSSHSTLYVPTASDVLAIPTCPKCGTKEDGRPSCCAPDGAWSGLCGDNKEHTWSDGFWTCRRKCTKTYLTAQ